MNELSSINCEIVSLRTTALLEFFMAIKWLMTNQIIEYLL